MSQLQEQENIIQLLTNHSNRFDILSFGRCLDIEPSDFDSEVITVRDLSERFVTLVYQRGKGKDLKQLFNEKYGEIITNNVSNKAADIFVKLLNTFLNAFNEIEEKDFEESELIDPIEFEKKMRQKAKLNEDIVKAGLRIKPDISVLRRKAYALDYKKYEKLIQKMAKYYMYTVCHRYPLGEYDSSYRFQCLYNDLSSMIPQELYEKDDSIDEKIEGIIFDTLSRCLIFNE